jgi:hypothetical protein
MLGWTHPCRNQSPSKDGVLPMGAFAPREMTMKRFEASRPTTSSSSIKKLSANTLGAQCRDISTIPMFHVLLLFPSFSYLSHFQPVGSYQPRLVIWEFGSESKSNIRVLSNSYPAFEMQTSMAVKTRRDW